MVLSQLMSSEFHLNHAGRGCCGVRFGGDGGGGGLLGPARRACLVSPPTESSNAIL